VNGHAPLADTPMTNCKAFGVWVRVLLGVCTVSALIALRSYGLYRVFCRNLPYDGFGLYMPFLVYCMCIAVYGIVSQVLAPHITIYYMELVDICYYEGGYKASLFALLWVTWILVALINWRIRKIREMLGACVAVFAILIFTTAMHYTRPEYPLTMGLRIATTTLDHAATNIVWWLIMAVPMYQCLFHRKAYLDAWVAKLRRDGLQREYQVASDSLRGTSFGDRQKHGAGPLMGRSSYLEDDMAPTDAYFYFNGGNADGIEKHNANPYGNGFYYGAHLESTPSQYPEHIGAKEREDIPADTSSDSSLVGQSMSPPPSSPRTQNTHELQHHQSYASVHFSHSRNPSAPLRLNDANDFHLEPFDRTII
ncbi:hypothetical protein LPJ59_001252, partial [Coemansia sp. RSA 2399]